MALPASRDLPAEREARGLRPFWPIYPDCTAFAGCRGCTASAGSDLAAFNLIADPSFFNLTSRRGKRLANYPRRFSFLSQ
jgi:hypothetical protein